MAIEVKIKKKLKGFLLDVAFSGDHEIRGILGASGSGKSMTLKCIAGIVTPDEGRIVVDGQVLYDSEKKIDLPPQKRNVGYLFQNYALFPTMTVAENIGVSTRNREERTEIVRKQIADFQLEGLENRYPRELSGGQQQRVALARMLAKKPAMIMLDEPFSALDGFLRTALQRQMKEMLSGYPGEVLMVSHSRDEVYQMCEKLTIIDRGRSLLSGGTKAIFQDPQIREAARLTGCRNLSRAERVDAHHIYAQDWKVTLTVPQEVGADIHHVGIRAHFIRQAEEKEENTLPVLCTGYVEAPFEHQYLIRNVEGGEDIWWLTAKQGNAYLDFAEKEMTVSMPKECLMLLK